MKVYFDSLVSTGQKVIVMHGSKIIGQVIVSGAMYLMPFISSVTFPCGPIQK